MRRNFLLLGLLLPTIPGPLSAQTRAETGRQAIAAAQAQRWVQAEGLAAQADPLVAKLVRWMRLTTRGAPASSREVVEFIATSPDWPMPLTLRRRAEELLATDPDDALALRHFENNPALTLDGATRHVTALLNAGRRDAALDAATLAWAEDTEGDAAAEPAFLARATPLLDELAHARRADRLAFARDFAAVQRLLPLLDARHRAINELRLAYSNGRDADPAAAARDGAATLERARMLRQRDEDAAAAQAWAAGAVAQRGLDPDAQRASWNERHILVRKLLRLNEPALAYQVAAQHGQTEPGIARQEAEFMAGFAALRFLNDPARALPHFQRLRAGSQSPITQSRSLYWEGRAERDQGRARARFAEAAAFPVTFYGQMASLALGETPEQLSARINGVAAPQASAAQTRAFQANELVRLISLLGEMGEGRRTRPFLLRLVDLQSSPAEYALTARLAIAIGQPDHGVWVTRRASSQGAMLVQEGWPRPFRAPPNLAEPALVYAITRQESNFETTAVSRSNARGLMQLLPATARDVARRQGIPHQLSQLINDPEHNLRLGSAYIQERLERFGGVMVFAAAGYNAGSGRVDQWLATYGDPRQGTIRMLDWMEMIPFAETRNYVQRVIENVAVYRAMDPATRALPHPMAEWQA
ncbi:lytic transglycosylase domain-containing protein [Roseococcus microcysteis]|uniref:lytic transglycosylase domain-containing protein n=1 Tax=Roseococcus microcysteis TaxID=2771361 RepID=UPI00168A6C37|nr:lytic transglycosylase domain-containing protein [Roseococcus microcysteis]